MTRAEMIAAYTPRLEAQPNPKVRSPWRRAKMVALTAAGILIAAPTGIIVFAAGISANWLTWPFLAAFGLGVTSFCAGIRINEQMGCVASRVAERPQDFRMESLLVVRVLSGHSLLVENKAGERFNVWAPPIFSSRPDFVGKRFYCLIDGALGEVLEVADRLPARRLSGARPRALAAAPTSQPPAPADGQ